MRDAKRIDKVLDTIKKVWEKHPDLRLGQLICNVFENPSLYYIEDEKLAECLVQYYKLDEDVTNN